MNQLTEDPPRPVKRNGKKVNWTLEKFGVIEGGEAGKLAEGWIEARASFNAMTPDERKDAVQIKGVAKKVYEMLGGRYAK